MADVSMEARRAWERRMGRALILGGSGCTVAGVAAIVFSTGSSTSQRLVFASLALAVGLSSVATGIIFRVRTRPRPGAG